MDKPFCSSLEWILGLFTRNIATVLWKQLNRYFEERELPLVLDGMPSRYGLQKVLSLGASARRGTHLDHLGSGDFS